MTNKSRFISQEGIENFIFYKASSLAPGWKINTEWSYTSIPLHGLTARIGSNLKGNIFMFTNVNIYSFVEFLSRKMHYRFFLLNK
jgi:hypothetical protein